MRLRQPFASASVSVQGFFFWGQAHQGEELDVGPAQAPLQGPGACGEVTR